ncbi:MAG: hypothetical protein M0R77_08460 [Gammaproteobacteria bacterium]|nr:hypothetical protein [Gammaproteobacteria bacterium]
MARVANGKEARQYHNRGIILDMLSSGEWPSVNKVLKAGGKGSTGDVHEDVQTVLTELVARRDRPDVPPEVLALAEQAFDKAWERLEPYREEADQRVQVADERVKLVEKQHQTALAEVEGLKAQIKQLRTQVLDLERRLAAESQRVSDAADVRSRLEEQLREERAVHAQRQMELAELQKRIDALHVDARDAHVQRTEAATRLSICESELERLRARKPA